MLKLARELDVRLYCNKYSVNPNLHIIESCWERSWPALSFLHQHNVHLLEHILISVAAFPTIMCPKISSNPRVI